MQTESALTAVGHAIQLSVAPVFLLTAIGAFLGVLTNRLGRVIDRARIAEARHDAAAPAERTTIAALLMTLARRARLINRAITLCTITALLVCSVVVALFIGASLRIGAGWVVATLFIAAMGTLMAGLIYFLREIFVATSSVMIGGEGVR